MIIVYVISLESSRERRAAMRLQLDSLGIPFRFFDAVDGRKMSAEALMAAAPRGGTDYGGLLLPGEIGCALSHLAVMREIAEGEHDYAAVIEDDVFVVPEAREFFDEQLLRTLPPFDILQLGATTKRPQFTLDLGRVGAYRICTLPRWHKYMYGLIYTRGAARSIAASITDITAPIDNMVFHDRFPFGLRVIELRPAVVEVNYDFEVKHNLTSDIGVRPRPRRFFSKLARELRRFRNWRRMWRSFVYVYGLPGVLRLHVM